MSQSRASMLKIEPQAFRIACRFFWFKSEICCFQPISTTLRCGWDEDRTEKLNISDKINFQKSTPLKALGWSCHMVWTGVVYDRWISEVASCKYFLWCTWTTCSVDQYVIIHWRLDMLNYRYPSLPHVHLLNAEFFGKDLCAGVSLVFRKLQDYRTFL